MFDRKNASGPACTEEIVTITASALPLSCPPIIDQVWDAHPRVYLPIEVSGQEKCPYCGTIYRLASALQKDAND